MTINLLQDRTPGNEYRAVISVPTNGVHQPKSAHNTPNAGGVSAAGAVVIVDANGNAVTSSRSYGSATVTPTVTAGSYALNNVVGGSLAFTGLTSNGSATVDSAVLTIKSTQTAPFDLYLFTAPVATAFTDHANATLNASDAAKLLGIVSFASPKSAFGGASIYTVGNTHINVQDNGAGIVGVLVSGGTPTLASTSDVVLSLHTSA